MKSFAFVLLCVIAVVQGRSAGVKVANQRAVAALGENPWVVHLRLAVSTSGLLETCAGSLIDEGWILTSASCVHDARFIWARFGAVEVIRPELVLESSAVRLHQLWEQASGVNNIALVAVNRAIENSQNIAVVALPAAVSDVADSANFCAYGQLDENTPGEELSCWDVNILAVNDLAVIGDVAVSKFDTGAALVNDGVQIGLVSQGGESEGTAVFTRIDAYVGWITSQTGVEFGRAQAPAAPAASAAPEAPGAIFIVDN